MEQINTEPTPKLHQQLDGIRAVEIDHMKDTAYAWYGGAEVFAIRCSDGCILERYTLGELRVQWTLDEFTLKQEVKDALLGLKSDQAVVESRLAILR